MLVESDLCSSTCRNVLSMVVLAHFMWARQVPSGLTRYFFFVSPVAGFHFLPLPPFSIDLRAIFPALTKGTQNELYFCSYSSSSTLRPGWSCGGVQMAPCSHQYDSERLALLLHPLPNVLLFPWAILPCCLLLCLWNTFSLTITLFPACTGWL